MADDSKKLVSVINLPAIDRQLEKLRKGAPNKIAGEGNVVADKITQTARATAPVGPGTKHVSGGQFKEGFIPKFSTRKDPKETEAEVHNIAPHSPFVEAGTGTRGRGSWKKQIINYAHGGKPGMKAFNTLQNAADKHTKDFREGVIRLVNAGLR